MLLFVRQLTVLEGQQAGHMTWAPHSYRLGPASFLPMPGSDSAALLLFLRAQEGHFS